MPRVATTSLSIVQSICTCVHSLSFTLPPRFPRSDWPPLVTSKYNRILLVQFASDCTRVRAEAKKTTKVSTQRRRTVTRTKNSGKRASDFELSSKQLERGRESWMKSILISTVQRHSARNKLSILRYDLNPLIYTKLIV